MGNEEKMAKILEALRELTDSERYILFHEFCVYCGDINPQCQCWNDE